MIRSTPSACLCLLLALVLVVPVGAVTVVIYAQNDGTPLHRNDAGESWANMIAGPGTSTANNGTYNYPSDTVAHGSGSDTYTYMYKYGMTFNTSTIGAFSNITSAVLRTRFQAKITSLGGQNESALVKGTPTNPLSFAAGDYTKFETTELAPRFDYTSTTTGNINYTLNAAGRAAINKAGLTTLYNLDGDELDGTFSGTWVAAASRQLRVYGAVDATNPPYLEVTYTPVTCPIWLETMFNVTGDGSDEGMKVQNAFTFSATNGTCPIIFPDNKVIVFSNQLTVGAGTEVIGNGSTLKMIDSWGAVNDGSGALIFGDGDYIHGLKFDGNRANVNSTIGSLNINNIVLNHNVTFEDNEVKNTMAYGTNIYKKNNVVIKDNFFHDGNQYGFSTGGNGQYSENISVHDNTFWNFTEIAIKLKGCGNSTFSNNTIIVPDGSGFSSTGIQFSSTDAPNKNIVLNNNTITGDFTNTTGAGLTTAIGSSDNLNPGSVITNNTINSTYNGISIAMGNALIANNSVSNSRNSGLVSVANDSEFFWNTLINSGTIIGGSGTFPTNNTFRYNNIITGNDYWRAEGDGAFLWYGGMNNTFDFNVFNVTRYGFNINSSFGLVYNTTITNNTIEAEDCFNDEGITTYFFNNTCNAIPKASFTTNTTSGTVPLAVAFTDTSTNTPTGWNWSFGDGNWSNGTASAVSYLYEYPGTYNAFLIASNGGGSSQSVNTTITANATSAPAPSLQCQNQTGNITINLFSNSTSTLGWNWQDPGNITQIAEDGLFVTNFDNSSDYFIGTGYLPESWHKLKIYNQTDYGQLNCTTDAVPVTPTPIPIMPSTESNVDPINIFSYWPLAIFALGFLAVFVKW